MSQKSNRELAEDFQRWRKENAEKVAKEAARRHKRKDYNWKTHLKNTYDITPEQYNQMFDEQNGCCAICNRSYTLFKKRLCVDHNHKTGEIRGLLCDRCNRELIGRISDPELFYKAADYLTNKHTGWFVAKQKNYLRKSNVKKYEVQKLKKDAKSHE